MTAWSSPSSAPASQSRRQRTSAQHSAKEAWWRFRLALRRTQSIDQLLQVSQPTSTTTSPTLEAACATYSEPQAQAPLVSRTRKLSEESMRFKAAIQTESVAEYRNTSNSSQTSDTTGGTNSSSF